MTANNPPRIAAGTKIDHYEIVNWLGAGGMGVVYRARDPRLDRDVAIKLISDTVATDASRAIGADESHGIHRYLAGFFQ